MCPERLKAGGAPLGEKQTQDLANTGGGSDEYDWSKQILNERKPDIRSI